LLLGHAFIQPAANWFESTMTLRTAKWASPTVSNMPVALRDMDDNALPVAMSALHGAVSLMSISKAACATETKITNR
jgi:hypothetical protein